MDFPLQTKKLMPLYKSYLRHTKIQISLLFPLPTILIVKIKDQNILFLRKKLMTPNFNDWACAFHHVHLHNHSIHPSLLNSSSTAPKHSAYYIPSKCSSPCLFSVLFEPNLSATNHIVNPWNSKLAGSHQLRISGPRGRYFKYRLSVHLVPNLSCWLDFVGVCCFG